MKFDIFGYTISLVRIVEPKQIKKKTGFTSKRWTPEELESLVEMNGRGLTAVGMARRLGRTVPAVTSKLWNLKQKGK